MINGGRTTMGRALQQIMTMPIARNADLAASDDTVADDALSFIIQRIPLPFSVGGAQNIQPLLSQKSFLHDNRKTGVARVGKREMDASFTRENS